MSNFVPCYYDEFRCIADKCKHNCCIGWEIDIDSDTLCMYENIGGKLGVRLSQSIDRGGETPHFVLDEKDRCPFLDCNGLCDIITALGEDGLCNICADHPRFRNFYENFTEIGLGICCEEAARVVLNCTEPFSVKGEMGENTPPLGKEEKEVYTLRQELFDILSERSKSFLDVISAVSEGVGLDIGLISLDKLREIYLSLERLDDKWSSMLDELKGYEFTLSVFLDDNLRIPFEQLACYFIYRHLPDAIFDENLNERIRFAVVSVLLIGAMYEKGGNYSMDALSEIARMYSAEVEYSDDNMARILDELREDVIYG